MAREVRRRGHDCIMVQSTPDVPPMYRSSFYPGDFSAIIRHNGAVEPTSAQLMSRNVSCVIPGCELGVELADQLSERLGLVTNGTRLSGARRNKFLMGETLHQRGVRAPAQCSSGSLDDVTAWVRCRGVWPVVLKPLGSSGSDGVALCANEAELQAAFADIMNRDNVFGFPNDAVLVQEHLTGTEYAVDTVSCEGQHKVAACWEYEKPGTGNSWFGGDSLELLPWSQTLHRRLFPYVASVLDALEIRNGPAHCEVMLSNEGPVIVEIGARLNGGNNPSLSLYGGSRSQIDLTLEACLDPARFLQHVTEPYALVRGAMRVFLTPPQPGRIGKLSGIERLEQLESFQEMHVSAKPGRSFSRIAGWVVLVHPDRAVLHRDRQQIRRLESGGLYQVEAGG